MRHRNKSRGDSNISIRVVCAVAFLLFSFCWLLHFQGDMLAVAQHGLSGGKTHYNRTIGAIIITAVLMGVELLVHSFTRLTGGMHALSYVPSFLLLAFVSSISYPFTWGAWPVAAILVIALWLGGVALLKNMSALNNRYSPLLADKSLWTNMLQMAVMMLIVVAVSNTNAVTHYRAHAELALIEGDTDEALHAGSRSLEGDASLTMLRIFALSEQGVLADRLFEYPVFGTSADMLPMQGSNSSLLLMADTLLWPHFGIAPNDYTVQQYLDSLEHDTLATPAWRDYRLMGQLIDRRLDTFVVCLPRYYTMEADSLPRHYREALVLYQQTVDTLFIYSDSLMLQRWHDFHHYDSIYTKPSERRIRTEDQFRDTYWYYFFQ